MIYDVIILGGGISGLYTAYLLLERLPKCKILILEKESYLGGRIHTYRDKHMQVEAGAGRYSESHMLFRQLLDTLHLKKYETPITSESVYIESETGHMMDSVFDSPPNYYNENRMMSNLLLNSPHIYDGIDQPVTQLALDGLFGKYTQPATGLLAKVLMASKRESEDVLRNQTFIQYASTILSGEERQFVEDSFGYYSELVVMNAYDTCKLLKQLDPSKPFYVLSCGLDKVIFKLAERLKQSGYVTIKKSKTVTNIKWSKQTKTRKSGGFFWNQKTRKYVLPPQTNENKYKIVCSDGSVYYGKVCVCTLPKNAITKLKVFDPLKPMLNKIVCGSLCRIYMKFDKENIWFRELPKCTTNNELRMVIPMDEKKGTIMISYSDNKYADYWKDVFEKEKEGGVIREITKRIKQVYGIEMPPPRKTKVFHWQCGVGYWGVGAHSNMISERLVKPYPEQELYICGESYSAMGQQWIEGGMEMAERVVYKMLK
jgi:hypothetical protein